MNSIGDVGVGGKLFCGVADDEDFLRKWCMADKRPTEHRNPLRPLGGQMPQPWSEISLLRY